MRVLKMDVRRSAYTKKMLKPFKAFVRKHFKEVQEVNYIFEDENDGFLKIKFYVQSGTRYYRAWVTYDKVFEDFINFDYEEYGQQTRIEI